MHWFSRSLYTHFFHLGVVLCQLFDTVNGKYQKSKKIATDSNYLRCHALLTALHFPLETTWSCKQDRKERYWGQQFCQMERDISGRPTEMTRPVTVDHLQSWSRIFRSDQTEMVRSIWCTNRNYRNFGLNGKRPKSFLFCFVLESTVVQSEMEVVLRCENYVQVDALTVVPWLQRSVLKIPNMK